MVTQIPFGHGSLMGNRRNSNRKDQKTNKLVSRKYWFSSGEYVEYFLLQTFLIRTEDTALDLQILIRHSWEEST